MEVEDFLLQEYKRGVYMDILQEDLKDEFTEWYNSKEKIFYKIEEKYKNLIETLISKESKLVSPQIESRVKSLNSCIAKIERKYLEENEEKSCQEICKKITDFVGIRVICSYEDEIPIVKEIVDNEFEIKGETDKTKEKEERDTFGYRGLHLDVKMKENRLKLPEYSDLSEFSVEIQIRTVIQDAWSRLEHKIVYKRNVPQEISRSTERLAALFEIADSEFIRLRDKTKEQEEKSTNQINKLEEGNLKEIKEISQKKIDFITFDKFLKLKCPAYTFSQENESRILIEIFECNSKFCLADLDSAYKNAKEIVEEFKKFKQISIMNPFTMLRHMLYFVDNNKYKNLLTKKQQNIFDDYLKNNR